jgi:hypothetical protein
MGPRFELLYVAMTLVAIVAVVLFVLLLVWFTGGVG